MKTIKLSGGITFTALAVAALSLIHPWGNLHADASADHAVLAGSNVPDEVRTVITQKCGDCHSNSTRWPLYSRVAPSSWLVEHDLHEGREHLNLSSW